MSPNRKPQPSRLRWFVAGIVSGVAASAAFAWLQPSPDSLLSSIRTLTGEPATQSAPPPEAPARPRFEFYHLLPEMEVAVPEHELVPPRPPAEEAAPAPEERTAPPAAARGERFLVQVGSFRGRDDAERLKATLALRGLESHIQTVAIDGAQTWHRVRLGPFVDLSAVNDARARLRAGGIESMVLKVRS